MKEEVKTFKQEVQAMYLGALRLENQHFIDGYPEMTTRTKNEVLYELKQTIKDLNQVIKNLESK